MPPKAKFTKKEIVDAALQIYREEGMESLTARNLGKRLGSSSCPIFTVFSGMEEVQNAMVDAAKAIYKSYVDRGLTQNMPFRSVGEEYVHFAMDEPQLFRLLFMHEMPGEPSFDSALLTLEDSYERILSSVTASYPVGEEQAKRLYRHLWVYTHGIACLCATKTCHFTMQEIEKMMSEVFLSLLKEALQSQTK